MTDEEAEEDPGRDPTDSLDVDAGSTPDDELVGFGRLEQTSTPQPPPPAPAGMGGAYPEESRAVVALVLTLVHVLFFFCPVLAPIGWYMAHQELTAIDAGRRDPSNRPTANAARIIGIVGTVVSVLFALGALVLGASIIFVAMAQ